MKKSTKLLFLLTFPESVRNQYVNGVKAAFPDVEVNAVDHHSKVGPYIGEAEALATFGPMMVDKVLADAPRLRWVQALGTGVDNLADLPSFRPGTILTNLHGIHGESMSEATLMLMLSLARGLPRMLRNQTQQRWERFPARILRGKTVGIFGVGAIAASLAPLCKALGMRTIGISSSPRKVPGFDAMRASEELIDSVRELDYFVLLTPYSAATHHVINAEVLAAMKPDAFLINLARGGVVDEAALLAVLQARRIAGAALDVFSQEPLPAASPFWGMDNVLITPHQGGFNDEYPQRALPVINHNLQCFLDGKLAAMQNLVKC